jgi:hypothetical protein
MSKPEEPRSVNELHIPSWDATRGLPDLNITARGAKRERFIHPVARVLFMQRTSLVHPHTVLLWLASLQEAQRTMGGADQQTSVPPVRYPQVTSPPTLMG